MNVRIVLEDVSIDCYQRKDDLLDILKKYPNFKEKVLIEEADYLIIIPNYPMAGKQNFNKSLEDFIFDKTDHIDCDKILLLDCDNTFYLLDCETPTYKGVHFLDKNVQITDIFGLSPKDIKQATDFIKTGKRPNVILEDKITEPLQEIKPKKRKMLLGL